ncbi:Hypothetical_protein [Hexamita inflata]|uniref:Hypothetical_protein n=1 Tax=Hexamita inflata TaxID=28002 RepID=A0AA86V8W2_9EUKA|nr:Hypothetical protein HINF_LOCUS47283 [Hexamita inflata]
MSTGQGELTSQKSYDQLAPGGFETDGPKGDKSASKELDEMTKKNALQFERWTWGKEGFDIRDIVDLNQDNQRKQCIFIITLRLIGFDHKLFENKYLYIAFWVCDIRLINIKKRLIENKLNICSYIDALEGSMHQQYPILFLLQQRNQHQKNQYQKQIKNCIQIILKTYYTSIILYFVYAILCSQYMNVNTIFKFEKCFYLLQLGTKQILKSNPVLPIIYDQICKLDSFHMNSFGNPIYNLQMKILDQIIQTQITIYIRQTRTVKLQVNLAY